MFLHGGGSHCGVVVVRPARLHAHVRRGLHEVLHGTICRVDLQHTDCLFRKLLRVLPGPRGTSWAHRMVAMLA